VLPISGGGKHSTEMIWESQYHDTLHLPESPKLYVTYELELGLGSIHNLRPMHHADFSTTAAVKYSQCREASEDVEKITSHPSAPPFDRVRHARS
jgi:hypothetical protein